MGRNGQLIRMKWATLTVAFYGINRCRVILFFMLDYQVVTNIIGFCPLPEKIKPTPVKGWLYRFYMVIL